MCAFNYSKASYRINLFMLASILICISNIDAIVRGPPTIRRLEDPKNRELLDIPTKTTKAELDKLSTTFNCLYSFIDIFLNRLPRKLTIWIAEFQDPNVGQTYLSAVQRIRPSFVMSDDLTWESYNENALEIVIIIESPDDVHSIPDSLVYLGDDDCRYGIVLAIEYEDDKSFMDVAKNLTSMLWDLKKIANAAILGVVNQNLLVSKSTSYIPGELRHPSNPILMDRCNANRRWNESLDIFEDMDMTESNIRVAYFLNEPYIHKPKNDSTFEGLEVYIVRIISKKIGCHIYASKMNYDNGSAVEELVKEKFTNDSTIDLILGGILWEPTEFVDFTIPYDVVQVVWMIPMHSNISLRGLVTPLSAKVWYAVLGVIAAAIILRIFLFKDIPPLEILALVIGIGWPIQPTRDSARFHFISYVIFGFLIVQFYLASMAGQFMAQADVQIDTMADMVDSGLKYGGTKGHSMMFSEGEGTNHDDDHDVMEHIAHNFITFEQNEYETVMQDLIDGKNTTVALAVTMNMSAVATKFNKNKVHILNEVLSTYPLAFPLWKGLPYLDRIDSILARLTEGGIITYLGRYTSWKFDGHYQYDDDDDDNTYLRLNDLVPGLLLLVMGHGMALLSFLAEIAIHKWKTHSKKRDVKVKKGSKKSIDRVVKKVSKKGVDKAAKKSTKRNIGNIKGNVANMRDKMTDLNHRKVIVKQLTRPNVKIGYYKDMY